MEWIEANPLPPECQGCKEEECYNCDCAGERWYLSEEGEQMIRWKMQEKAAERQRRRNAYDEKL